MTGTQNQYMHTYYGWSVICGLMDTVVPVRRRTDRFDVHFMQLCSQNDASRRKMTPESTADICGTQCDHGYCFKGPWVWLPVA